MEEMRKTYRILVENLTGRPRHKWKDIRMDLKDIGSAVVDWISLAQGEDHWQVLMKVMNFLAS
jgi:hypothetical protein